MAWLDARGPVSLLACFRSGGNVKCRPSRTQCSASRTAGYGGRLHSDEADVKEAEQSLMLLTTTDSSGVKMLVTLSAHVALYRGRTGFSRG